MININDIQNLLQWMDAIDRNISLPHSMPFSFEKALGSAIRVYGEIVEENSTFPIDYFHLIDENDPKGTFMQRVMVKNKSKFGVRRDDEKHLISDKQASLSKQFSEELMNQYIEYYSRNSQDELFVDSALLLVSNRIAHACEEHLFNSVNNGRNPQIGEDSQDFKDIKHCARKYGRFQDTQSKNELIKRGVDVNQLSSIDMFELYSKSFVLKDNIIRHITNNKKWHDRFYYFQDGNSYLFRMNSAKIVNHASDEALFSVHCFPVQNELQTVQAHSAIPEWDKDPDNPGQLRSSRDLLLLVKSSSDMRRIFRDTCTQLVQKGNVEFESLENELKLEDIKSVLKDRKDDCYGIVSSVRFNAFRNLDNISEEEKSKYLYMIKIAERYRTGEYSKEECYELAQNLGVQHGSMQEKSLDASLEIAEKMGKSVSEDYLISSFSDVVRSFAKIEDKAITIQNDEVDYEDIMNPEILVYNDYDAICEMINIALIPEEEGFSVEEKHQIAHEIGIEKDSKIDVLLDDMCRAIPEESDRKKHIAYCLNTFCVAEFLTNHSEVDLDEVVSNGSLARI